MLFVADAYCFSVSTIDIGGECDGNCIYFFDDDYAFVRSLNDGVDEVLGDLDVGVFKLEDGTGEPLRT